MGTYRIHNEGGGETVWQGEAASQDGALDAMSRDAGYRDHADACERSGDDGADLAVVEILPDSIAFCAICDHDREPGAAGEVRGDDWICADCLATEPSDEGPAETA